MEDMALALRCDGVAGTTGNIERGVEGRLPFGTYDLILLI